MLTAEGDDRVVPLHTYKFVATLNSVSPQTLGLMKVMKNAGHGAGMSKEQSIKQIVEEHAFLKKTLGPVDQKTYKAHLAANQNKKIAPPKVK